MSKSARLETTQPPSHNKVFRKAASLEGITLSEFVGEACLARAAKILGVSLKELKAELGERIRRGER
jgi:uncharacterized protein (DUF1778 family)